MSLIDPLLQLGMGDISGHDDFTGKQEGRSDRISAQFGPNPIHGLIQIDGQFGSSWRPQGEFAIAGKNHQSDLLSRRNDLVVGLQFETQFVESPEHQWLALAQRLVVLRIGPSTRD